MEFASERMATGEIVEDERVARLELGQLLVHSQAAIETSALGVMVAQDLQRFDVLGIAADEAFKEGDFDVELASLFAS
jgi:hypothetical protein